MLVLRRYFYTYLSPPPLPPMQPAVIDPLTALLPTMDTATMAGNNWQRDAVSSYAQLESWVDNSLDVYRASLRGLLFPVFAHFYIRLTRDGHIDEARQLMVAHGRSHETLYEESIGKLKSVVAKEQLLSNDFTSRLCSARHRFIVSMRREAQTLLTSYLEDAQLRLVVQVLNGNVKILSRELHASESATSDPWFAEGEYRVRESLDGEQAVPLAQDVNREPLLWGVLPKHDLEKLGEKIDRQQQRALDEAASEAKSGTVAGNEATAVEDSNNSKKRKRVPGQKQCPPWVTDAGEQTRPPYPKYASGSFVADLVRKQMLRTTQAAAVKEHADLQIVAQNPLGYHSTPPNGKAIANPTAAAVRLPHTAHFSIYNNSDGLCCTSVSRDAVQLAAGYADSSIRVWRFDRKDDDRLGLSFGEKSVSIGTNAADAPGSVFTSDQDGQAVVECTARLVGHSMSVTSCAFSPDNQLLYSASQDSSVRLWDLKTRAELVAYQAAPEGAQPIWAMDLCSLGNYFATGSHDKSAALWSSERTAPLRRFIGHSSDVQCVRFHPNSTMIASGSLDQTVHMWDIVSGKCVRSFASHTSGVTALDFSPDGKVSSQALESPFVYSAILLLTPAALHHAPRL